MDSLVNFNINTWDDLLNFRAQSGSKMQEHLERELNSKLFQVSLKDIFLALPFAGFAKTNLEKIIDFYGFDNVINPDYPMYISLAPAGLGPTMLFKFGSQRQEMISLFLKITKHPNYFGWFSASTSTTTTTTTQNPTTKQTTCTSTPTTGGGTTQMNEEIPAGFNGSICFTGKLNNMTRTEAERKAKEAGFAVKSSVSAGLDYLVTNNPDSGSTKNRKAQQYGTRIITEDDFLIMIQ